jgi:subtilisin family serine protease
MKGIIALALIWAFQVHATHINPTRLVIKIEENQHSAALSAGLRHLFGEYYIAQSKNVDSDYLKFNSKSWVEYVDYDYKSSQKLIDKGTPVKLKTGEDEKRFNDRMLGRQWHLKAASSHGVSVLETYDRQLSAPRETIIVAVVDTGVDYRHPDLKDVMWTNPGEIAGNGIDDDGNGYIDDIHGISTLERRADGSATSDPMDKHSHGTHVSGIIAASQNNSIGVAGVASSVRIMAVRTVPSRGDETDVDVAESFIYAAKNGARVINCSFGKRVNEGGLIVSEAIDFISREYGTLVVAASGNESANIDRSFRYPASFGSEGLMVVASTASRGQMSGFSNYGIKNVDIAAPGSRILSTTPRGRYSNMSGTSMASPVAAGVAAEVLANRPELTAIELKKHLMDNVVGIKSFETRMVSGGRIDLRKSLENL